MSSRRPDIRGGSNRGGGGGGGGRSAGSRSDSLGNHSSGRGGGSGGGRSAGNDSRRGMFRSSSSSHHRSSLESPHHHSGGGGGGNPQMRGSRSGAELDSSRTSSGGGGGGYAPSRGGNPGGGGGSQSRNSGGGRSGGGGSSGMDDYGGKFSGQMFTDSELMLEIPRKKFTGRCRLFVGNLPNEVKDAELKELFSAHGEISECYLSGKGFAFVRLDTRAHAESSKEQLDGKVLHGRAIRVRFAVHGATIKLKELSPFVSNEMLYLTFSQFGEVERAVHIVDEKGKPTGEGIIEFERKGPAQEALAHIRDRVFLMTANSRPLTAELLEPRDEEDGLSERMLIKGSQLQRERELGPRFAAPNSFEHVYGQRWKELYALEAKRRAELEVELKESRMRLESDMEVAYDDYKTQLMREDLQRRQKELERLEDQRRERLMSMGINPSMTVQMPGVGGPPGGGFFGAYGGGGPMRGPPLPSMMREPPNVDGPLGRGAPTFGPGAGPGKPPAPFPPSNGQPGRGGDIRQQQQQHQQHQQQQMDVEKIMLSFKNPGATHGGPHHQLGGPLSFFGGPGGTPLNGPIPPPPSVGGGLAPGLMNLMGPFMGGPGGPGGRPGGPPGGAGGIPPPPSMGAAGMNMGMGMDFGMPAEKRARR